MNDRLGMMTMQPDAARSMLGEMSDWERLGFDLNMPDSAPDEHKRAAARRISSVLEVPDSTGDGRLWRRNKARFKSGAEYLDTLRETVRKGNIWELAASEELQEFDAADRERRVQMARKAQGMLGRWFRAVAGAVKHRYGLEDGNAYLRDAPEEIVAANARLREDNRLQSDAMLKMAIEAETLGMEPAGSRTPPRERKAMRSDRELMAKWYQQRDEDALVDEYAQKLFDQHFALVWMHLAPQLSDAAREMVERGLKEQKLRGKDILDFQLLDEQEQEIAARLLRLSRDPVEGGFWNTLGDAGVGFVNGVVSIPQNVTRQLRKGIDQYIFGVNSSVEDMEEKNRWARMEQRLYEALDDYPLLDLSGADHWYPARAVIGAISTLPYMGYAALPFGAGLVMVALDFGERMDAQIARGGEDVYGRGVKWDVFKLLMGGVYAVTEGLQADRLLAGGDMSLRIALAAFGREGGWQAAKTIGKAWAVDTAVQSFQEGLQDSVEEITRQVGMREGVNAEAVIKAGVDEFVETLGTMGILSAVGMGRRAKWERSVVGRKALVYEVAGVLQRNSFLQSENPYRQKAPVSATLAAEADVAARVHELRQAWQDGGAEGLQRNRLSAEQADFLDGVFRAEQVQQEMEQEICERNMEIAQEADASGAVPVTVARLVAVVEGDRASAEERLQEMGFSEAGAAKIARWVDGMREQEERQADARDTIRQALAHQWQRGEGLADARDDAMQLAAELGRLRTMYQRSGTEAQAAKVFERAGFGSELATKLAALFAAEHKFATSPDAAAAFRALYLGQSVDMTLAERAQRMSGWEQVQEGDGVFRMRRRDAQGNVVADVAVRQQDVVEFDPEGEYAGEAVELVSGGAMTAEMWRGMSADERRAWADQHRISAQGGFVLRSGFKGEEAQAASEEQARVLLGEIMIQTGVSSATIYHEAVHAWAAMMRQSGMLSDADIKKLQERYGVSATDAGWFNEEALADDIQEIGAASDYRPEQGLAARFMAVVRSLTGRARAQEARQVAAQGARRTLFESIVYGTDWEGVGEFAEVVRKKEERGADPLEGVGSKQAETGTVKAGKVVDSPTPQTAPRRAPPPARKDDTWSAATPQGNVRVGGKWIIAPRNRFISDTDMERYDFSLQGRTRDATRGSSEQVHRIATEAEFDPLRLMDSSDIATGAPIAIRVEMQNDQGKTETYYMVLSGNGIFRALDIVDADHRGDTYRNPIRKFADERGIAYNESDMTAEAQPRLVRVLTRKPVGVTYQRIAELSNQDVVLRMTDAERASADAELIRSHGKADLYNANRDGTASKSGSNEFMYWFVGATGDAGLVDSKGNLTDAARLRARNAMLALIIGQGQKGKESVAAFIEQAEALGLERQRDAILVAAGELSALGELKPEYELAQEFSAAAVAMLEIARTRKAGKKVDAESYLAQGDMFEKHSPAFGSILRLLDGGRSTEWVAGVLRRYAELAGKIDTTTQDIFGVELASKAELLEQAAKDAETDQARYSLEMQQEQERQQEAERAADSVMEEMQTLVEPQSGQVRWSLVAERIASHKGIDAQGEKLVARQLEMLFDGMQDVAHRQGRREGKAASKLLRSALADAFRGGADNVAAWRRVFELNGEGTVSRILHQHYMLDAVLSQREVARVLPVSMLQGMEVKTTRDAVALLLPLRSPYQESMKVVSLDANDKVLGVDVITVGILNGSMVHPREVFGAALRRNAKSVLVAHNHPSTNPDPSPEDKQVTAALRSVADTLGLKFRDHIITNGKQFYSFTLGEIVNEVKADLASWEVLNPYSDMSMINEPKAAGAVAAALRQASEATAHIMVTDHKMKLQSVVRIGVNQADADWQMQLIRQVMHHTFAERGSGVILEIADIDEAAAKSLYALGAKLVNLCDVLYSVDGWMYSAKSEGNARLLPLTPEAAQQSHVAERGADMRYSLAAREVRHWDGQLDRYEKGLLNKREDVRVLDRVPVVLGRVLQEMGIEMAEGAPIVVSPVALDKITGEFIYSKKGQRNVHGVSVAELRKVVTEIDDPIAVFVSDTRPHDSLTVLVSVVDSDTGTPSIMAVDYTAYDTTGEHAMRITSIYSKPVGVIQGWLNRGLARYVNKSKTAHVFRQIRLQLPAAGIHGRHEFLTENDFRSEQLGMIRDLDGDVKRDARYSLEMRRAYDAELAGEEYRAVEAAWRNADGSYKDGWLKAPNGKQSNLTERQWVQVRTPSFKAWFGDWERDPENASKVVDRNGEPKPVAHGTNADFNVFDLAMAGSSTDAGWLGAGFYFYGAQDEINRAGYGKRQMMTFLNIREPYYATAKDLDRLSASNSKEVSDAFREELANEDYDGVFYDGDLREEWVAHNPNQIKSATDNTGAFSKTDADIRYSLAAREMAPSELSTSQESPALKGAGDIRYALDWRGAAYGKEHTLTAFMAHAVLTGQPVPSARTMTMLAQRIGVENINYPQMSRDAQRMARETSDRAILRAAQSGDPQLAAYAIGEMARQEQERRLVREGAKAGDKLARARERIRSLSDAERMKAMRDLTGADMADMEADIDVDLAATILAAEPQKFAPQEDKKPEAAFAKAEGGEAQVGRNDTDEDAPELTDKQRAEIARRRREREARIQEMLDAAKQRGDVERARALERKLRRKGEQRVAAQEGVESTTADSSARAGAVADVDIAGEKMPIALADKWEAAALMRVWAFERWKRENPLRMGEQRDVSKDRVAVEFYRKTLTRTLKDMARKLLAPGYAREVVLGYIADITAGQTANMMERKSAYILGLLNRYAIREERKSLVQKFRREIKRQFVQGAHFEELGLDIDRVVRGQVEEDARYVMRVCEMSSDGTMTRDGVSALDKERARLNLIIADRMGMTDADGNRLDVGDDDMSLRRALRQLALLDTYGGMINMMPGEILDLQGDALAGFAREAMVLAMKWQEMDKIVSSIRDPLVQAIMRDIDAPRVDDQGVVGRVVDSLIGMLRLRLDNLTRYEKDPARREAAREAIGELMDLLARGRTDYVNAIHADQRALMQALAQIHRKPDGTPDRKAIRQYLRSLDERIPTALAQQLSRQGLQATMTRGQMLQLLVYLDQWASYAHNIKKHDRVGQAALIRNFAYEDKKTGEMRRVYTPEDAQLIEWLRRQHYADKRGAISAVTERIAGRDVASPDPLYMPVRMYRETRQGLVSAYGGAWQPLSGVFSRRVRHGLDVDESASILDMFYDRTHETALLTSYTERGIIIREVLTSIQFQDAVRRFFGPAELKKILSQVTQSLNAGKRPGEYKDPSAALAMRLMTYIALGWNMLTPLKQTTSLPVWANRIGFGNFFKYLVNIDRQALREMRESDEYKIRYGTGPESGMSPAEQAAYDAPMDSRAKKFFGDAGLWLNRRADWLVSSVIGQGLYRDLTVKYMEQGMAEDAAKRRAMSETFSMIEETQSSTRAENLPALRREGGLLGKLVTQFAITPLLQIQYELAAFREWRDLVRHGGPEYSIREARNRYMRALFLNHVVVPAAILFVTNLYKALTGDEPDWKKDGYWQTVLVAVLIGQFSRVFFAGALTESALNAFIKREMPRRGQLIPAEGVISFGAGMVVPIRDIVMWDMDNFEKDLRRALRNVAATRLPLKLYENYIEE